MHILFKVFSWIVLALSVTSCLGIDEVGVDVNVIREYPVKLSAGAYMDTRITHDDLSLNWQQTDTLKIAAVASDGTYATSKIGIYSIDAGNASCASFAGFVSMLSQPQNCYFMYPASAATSYNSSTGRVKFQYNQQTGRHDPMMYAKVAYDEDGMSVVMKHAGAILQLSVDVQDLKSITFAGNKLENIYPVEIDPADDRMYFPNEVGVQITVPVQEDGPTYICVPPVKLEKGFSLICTKADGTYMVKSFSSDGSLSGGYDFSDKVGSLIPVEVSGEFENFQISATGLSGNHTKNGSLLTGTQVQFKMNKAGASNKLIEEWGANLLNSEGKVVRTITYTNTTPINGQTVTMNVANNWKLLPEGDYIFTPYYKIYGQQTTLPSQLLAITDPGVSVKITGNTSYDKYKAGNVSGANSHTNTLIESLAVSTNLDVSIVDSRDLILDGSSLGMGTWSSGSMTYGNQTRTERRSYACEATVKVGPLTFTSSRTFDITGLPLVADFSNDNQGWGVLGEKAKHDGDRIFFESKLIYTVDHAVVSPAFYIPADKITVKTFADISCKKDGSTLYVNQCIASNQNISVSGNTTITIKKQSSLNSVGYIESNQAIDLTSSKPALMFSATTPRSYGIALYKIKIEYK